MQMAVTGEQIGPARSRERFLVGDPVETGVRGPILTSWLRCRLLGLSPDQTELPYRDDFDPDSRLVRAAGPVLDRLQSRFAGSQMNISVADANGTVLQRRFGEPSLARSLPPIQSVPGFVFAERFAGTNGIGLALAERNLIQVYGAEHFAERSQRSACCAVPIRDQLSGRIVGVLCFGYPHSYERGSLAVQVRRAAETIERRLMGQSSARERGLLRTYLDAEMRARTGGAAGEGHHTGPAVAAELEQLADLALDPHDQTILKERATELIAASRRAAVDVLLPHGREATLLSRPVTSRAGVAGMVVEAVLSSGTAPVHHLPVSDRAGPLPTGPLPARTQPAGPPPAGPPAGPPPDTAGRGSGTVRGLVLVGEPEVGKYAIEARRRLELLAEASTRIGTTLDVGRTARELAETAVPALADYVTVDLPEAVLRGEESADPRTDLHRAVLHGIRDDCPFYPAGNHVELQAGTPRCAA